MNWFHRDAGRSLTTGERTLAEDMFASALDLDRVRLQRARWWPFQGRSVVMAPDGNIWFHPAGQLWRDDFSVAHVRLQALVIHELVHVWQHQRGICLPLKRHPFCRYSYLIAPGRPLSSYGIEQQAMIVEHAFLARKSGAPHPPLEALVKQLA